EQPGHRHRPHGVRRGLHRPAGPDQLDARALDRLSAGRRLDLVRRRHRGARGHHRAPERERGRLRRGGRGPQPELDLPDGGPARRRLRHDGADHRAHARRRRGHRGDGHRAAHDLDRHRPPRDPRARRTPALVAAGRRRAAARRRDVPRRSRPL
ncbi:MAG: hypothetical protein AVDCRST_MAG17-1479, partial [uncultured Solirubrobacterales bacterium]